LTVSAESGNSRIYQYFSDWPVFRDAVLKWSIAPYRATGSRQYEVNNEVSFVLQWIPINEIKSDVSYNKKNKPEWVVKGL
jgi:hypothetical protein